MLNLAVSGLNSGLLLQLILFKIYYSFRYLPDGRENCHDDLFIFKTQALALVDC